MGLIAFLPPRQNQPSNAAKKTSRFFNMKSLIELCALCFSLGKANRGFSQKGKTGKKDSFGPFSVRTVFPAVRNLFTYAIDENLFFEFSGTSSDYSKLDALNAVWRKK
jgi:hypothetical protein